MDTTPLSEANAAVGLVKTSEDGEHSNEGEVWDSQ